jgi:hypothetical protein
MGDAAESLEKWNKAERLAVASAVAPLLRSQGERALARRVARVDKDGKVVGYTTLAEVQKSLLRRREIELETVKGVRPKAVICENCGKDVPVKRKGGRLPTMCETKGGCFRQKQCARPKCRNKPTKSAFVPHCVRARNGEPWVCQSCRASETMAEMRRDPEIRERNLAAVRENNKRPEVLAKRAAVLRERNTDPSFREKVSKGKRKRYRRDPALKVRNKETCAKMRASKKPVQLKATCRRGHPMAGENLRVGPDGARRCRACASMHMANFKAKASESNGTAEEK